MKNATLVLFFAFALGIVFYGGLMTAQKLREPVTTEVRISVDRQGGGSTPLQEAPVANDFIFTPLPDTPLEIAVRRQREPDRAEKPVDAGDDENTTSRDADAVSAIEPPPPPQAETGPLEISYPKPMFVGTPVPIKLPNMRPPGKEGGTVTVPAGTRLLSRGKPVTASDDAPLIGELSYITDGDKSADEGSYVEMAGGLQWVQIDLKDVHRIFAVAVWHYHLQARAYKDVIILVSNDPEFKSGVLPVTRDVYTGSYLSSDMKLKAGAMLFNNDEDNSAGWSNGTDETYIETNRGLVVSGWGLPARYVRLYSNGNTSNGMNHYIEVEVYGI